MKRLVMGCTGVLTSLHVWEWGWYLRDFGRTELWTIAGTLLKLAAIILIYCSIRYGVIAGIREDQNER